MPRSARLKGNLEGRVLAVSVVEGAAEVSSLLAADYAALMTLEAQLLEEKTRIIWWGVCVKCGLLRLP